MYPDWFAWDNDLLLGTIILISHIITTSLVLAIFTSIFIKSKKKGYVFLIIILMTTTSTLLQVFHYSIFLGFSICLVYLCFGVITYFAIKRRKGSKTSNKKLNNVELP